VRRPASAMLGLLLIGGLANQALASTLLLTCSFPVSASPTGVVRSNGPGLRFEYFWNASTRTMTSRDGGALYPVTFVRGEEALTIIQERGPGGNVSTLTLVLRGHDAWNAVYSRHTLFAGGALVPSQHYGRCTHSGLTPIP
jgi:hypothetical protein